MAALYELAGAFAALAAQLEDCSTLEESQEILSQMDALNAEISVKGDAYARILQNLQADEDALDVEIKRLQARKAVAHNAAGRLKESMRRALEAAGARELATHIGKWKIALNPASVKVTDEARIPEAYWIPQPAKLDKKAILEAYRSDGELIPGTEIERTPGIRFR